jgi:hypothetical protein
LAFVLAEQDLSTVLALVGVYELNPRTFRQAFDRSLVPRSGVGWTLMKEQSPTFNLFDVDDDHEIQRHPGPDHFTTYHVGVSLRVVQGSPRTPCRAHDRANDHGWPLGTNFVQSLVSLGWNVEVPWHAVIWV